MVHWEKSKVEGPKFPGMGRHKHGNELYALKTGRTEVIARGKHGGGSRKEVINFGKVRKTRML